MLPRGANPVDTVSVGRVPRCMELPAGASVLTRAPGEAATAVMDRAARPNTTGGGIRTASLPLGPFQGIRHVAMLVSEIDGRNSSVQRRAPRSSCQTL